MIATVTAGILAASMIEISGLPAILTLLAPFVLLLIVMIRLRRSKQAPKQPSPETFRAVPSEATAPAAPGAEIVDKAPQPVDWALRIRSAEASNDQAALAGLYLSYAQAEIAGGRRDMAGDYLRSSVRAAAKSRNPAIQAEARLELAELARAAGDLTTACEHWQLARALFHDMKQQTRVGETEKLMQKHGCPTDWVLNDF